MKTAERARGALYGLAIGDALGMPTQMLSRPAIRDRWGDLLTGFEPAPPDHPIAAGKPAGAVTDDTEQAVLLGRLLIVGAVRVDARKMVTAQAAGEVEMSATHTHTMIAPAPLSALPPFTRAPPPH